MREAEVREFEVAVGAEKEVLWFDVAMDDVV